MIARLLLLLTFLLPVALAQEATPVTRRTDSRPDMVDVRGRVIDAKGAPISRAQVSLAWGDLHKTPFYRPRRQLPAATTDREGRFILRGVIPRDYYLLVRHDDFASDESPFVAETSPFQHPDVVLQPGGSIIGRVRVDTDLPKGGASVSIRRSGSFMDWCGSRTAIVGKDGAFDFRGLPAGEYELVVLQRGDESKQREQFLDYVTSRKKRPIIKVGPGEAVTFNE